MLTTINQNKIHESVLEEFLGYNGSDKLIPLTYIVESNVGHFVGINTLGEIPKELHTTIIVDLITKTQTWKDTGIKNIYCIMEVRSLPIGDDMDEETQENLKKWQQVNGSFEGFPGVVDYGFILRHSANKTDCMYSRIHINENNVRSIDKPIYKEWSISGTYLEILEKVFKTINK